jgi:hypothetical protein
MRFYQQRMVKPWNKTWTVAFSGFYQHCFVKPRFSINPRFYQNLGFYGNIKTNIKMTFQQKAKFMILYAKHNGVIFKQTFKGIQKYFQYYPYYVDMYCMVPASHMINITVMSLNWPLCIHNVNPYGWYSNFLCFQRVHLHNALLELFLCWTASWTHNALHDNVMFQVWNHALVFCWFISCFHQ